MGGGVQAGRAPGALRAAGAPVWLQAGLHPSFLRLHIHGFSFFSLYAQFRVRYPAGLSA